MRVTAQGVCIGGFCAGALPATGELHRIAFSDSPLAYFPDAEDYIYRLALKGAWDDTYGSTLDYLGESRSAVELMLNSVKVVDSLIKEVSRERNVSTLKKSVKRYLISQEAHIMVWTPRDPVEEVPDEDIEALFTFIADTLEDICRTCLVIDDQTVGRTISTSQAALLQKAWMASRWISARARMPSGISRTPRRSSGRSQVGYSALYSAILSHSVLPGIVVLIMSGVSSRYSGISSQLRLKCSVLTWSTSVPSA